MSTSRSLDRLTNGTSTTSINSPPKERQTERETGSNSFTLRPSSLSLSLHSFPPSSPLSPFRYIHVSVPRWPVLRSSLSSHHPRFYLPLPAILINTRNDAAQRSTATFRNVTNGYTSGTRYLRKARAAALNHRNRTV